jgi:pyruvate/2-oxoglutarate dehydrogenase complex dihydrolipoamide dehydrogenase (E3) component
MSRPAAEISAASRKRNSTRLVRSLVVGQGHPRCARRVGYGAKVMLADEYRLGGTHVILGSVRKKLFVYEPRLMPAKYARPFSKGQKNDHRDAEANAQAVQRPTMKFVVT